MKKIISMLLCVLMCISALAGCGKTDNVNSKSNDSSSNSENIELSVFAAASMTETLTELAEKYKETAPNVTLTFNFDSSGTLKTQIEEGAACDVFISAANKQMDGLDITADEEKNPNKLDFILTDSRCNLLENKVVLCVSKENHKNINSFDALAKALKDEKILMAMGNEDVPVGQYTQKILAYYKLEEKELADKGKITYGSNVKEVTAQISEGSVDCGIIYQTDAYSDNLTVVDTATKDMCGQVVYPAAVIKNSEYTKEAQDFLDYLKTADASDVFEKVGFTPLS